MPRYRISRLTAATKTGKNLDLQTAAAVMSAHHAGRAAVATWLGMVINVLVVAAAVGVPYHDRLERKYEKEIEDREQDRRVLIGSYSRLQEASYLLASGGLLDARLCGEEIAQNEFDSTRALAITQRMTTLNQVLFDQGVKTPLQIRHQAILLRMRDAVENAVTTLRTLPKIPKDSPSRYSLCVTSIYEVNAEAKVLQRQIIADYPKVTSKLSRPLFSTQTYAVTDIVMEDSQTLDAATKSIKIPDTLYDN